MSNYKTNPGQNQAEEGAPIGSTQSDFLFRSLHSLRANNTPYHQKTHMYQGFTDGAKAAGTAKNNQLVHTPQYGGEWPVDKMQQVTKQNVWDMLRQRRRG